MPNQQRCRLSYLLRLWPVHEVHEGKCTTWRALLENPQTGERIGFASLARLFAFLEDQTTVLAEGEAGKRLSSNSRNIFPKPPKPL